MTFWWEENIEAQLLDPASLTHMFPYMCKITAEDGGDAASTADASAATGKGAQAKDKAATGAAACAGRHDPITSTAITFLTCQLQLGLTEVGAMLFQGRSSLVYPYNLMSDKQKDFIREALSRRAEWNLFNNAVVFRKTPHQPRPGGGPGGLTLAPTAVLVALCSKIFESTAHPDPKRRVALCNIILQRVQGYIPIDRPVQKELNEWLAGRSSDEPPCDACASNAAGGIIKTSPG